MQLLSKLNKGISFLLFDSDIISNYAWVITLSNKKVITIANVFQKTVR